jgi:hypothetical protein
VTLLLTAITAVFGQKKTLAQQPIRAISVWCSSVYDVVIGLYVPQGLFDSTCLLGLHGAEECAAGYSLKEMLCA